LTEGDVLKAGHGGEKMDFLRLAPSWQSEANPVRVIMTIRVLTLTTPLQPQILVGS
jgi:hypothetical protein